MPETPLSRGSVAALLLGGGTGERLDGCDKAFLRHAGATLLDHAVALVRPFATDIRAGVPAHRVGEARRLLGECAEVRAGGATRHATLSRLFDGVAADIVLVHEIARPFAPPRLVAAVLEAIVAGAEAAVPAADLPIRDSVIVAHGDRIEAVIDRRLVRATQTPQAFRRTVLAESLALEADAVAAWAPLLRAGAAVRLVAGDRDNIKITWPDDLARLSEGP